MYIRSTCSHLFKKFSSNISKYYYCLLLIYILNREYMVLYTLKTITYFIYKRQGFSL